MTQWFLVPTVRRLVRVAVAGLSIALGACMGLDRTPLNVPVADQASRPSEFLPVDDFPDLAIGLAFSGGGMRAAAFSFGVLQGLDQIKLPGDTAGHTLLDVVDLVSGVSGGSVTAAYFGLKQREALVDFRERFLLKNAEAGFSASISLPNIVNFLTEGGANSSLDFGQWLDRELFQGATFASFRRKRNDPTVWISATDAYYHVPFLFSRETFSALCSDLDRMPVAQAVAASAAFPVVFAPTNFEAFHHRCDTPLPPWVEPAARDASGSAVRHAVASAFLHYRDPAQLRFVKLVDGGVTDNFGLQGIALARTVGETPYAPFTPEIAVQLRRALFLVVNAGNGPREEWPLRQSGPSGVTAMVAIVNAAIDSTSYAGYDYFRLLMRDWQNELVRWRCSLSRQEVARLRGRIADWHCDDLQIFVAEVSFADAGPERAAVLNAIPTRFTLPNRSVDFAIESGRIAVRSEPVIGRFLQSLQ
ncbi:MAG: patatin-like phospholipase family protein [Proteobacteria bacterium]|nr:patatin-like phospholipase family protein [Pseudomonadota bacterium]